MTQDPAVGSPRTQAPLAARGEGSGAEEAAEPVRVFPGRSVSGRVRLWGRGPHTHGGLLTPRVTPLAVTAFSVVPGQGALFTVPGLVLVG